MHQDTISRRDYSSFHLKAWCTQPELVPSSMELAVVEPPVRVQEEMSSKQTLGYKIGILVHSAPPPPPRAPRPLPLQDDSDEGPSRRRRRLQDLSESNLNSGTSRSPTARRCTRDWACPHQEAARSVVLLHARRCTRNWACPHQEAARSMVLLHQP
jgi:hypothetical protein